MHWYTSAMLTLFMQIAATYAFTYIFRIQTGNPLKKLKARLGGNRS